MQKTILYKFLDLQTNVSIFFIFITIKIAPHLKFLKQFEAYWCLCTTSLVVCLSRTLILCHGKNICKKKRKKTHTLLIFLSSWTSTTNMCYVKLQPICSSSIVPQTHYYSKHWKHVFFWLFSQQSTSFLSTKLKFSNLTTLFHLLFFPTIGSITLVHSFFSLTTSYQLHQIDFIKGPFAWLYHVVKRLKHLLHMCWIFLGFLCASKPICITY